MYCTSPAVEWVFDDDYKGNSNKVSVKLLKGVSSLNNVNVYLALHYHTYKGLERHVWLFFTLGYFLRAKLV